MEITKTLDNSVLTLTLAGRLDTNTAPSLQSELEASFDGVTELILDMASLEYISSAGLRVLLMAQKTMSKQGSMKLIHVCDEINEVFEITGFSDILTVE